MKKEILLFQRDELSFRNKFFILMDLLISNQVESRLESFLLLGIFYLQIITSFFSEQIGVLDYQNSKSDTFLKYIQNIIRIKDLFNNNYENLTIFNIIIFVILILLIFHFIYSCSKISRLSFYSFNLKFINYYIKIFIYIFYNITLDTSFSSLCFEKNDNNNDFNSVKCSYKKKAGLIIISILLILFSLVIYIFFSIYYNDSFYLSNSYYAKMSCNYEIYLALNCFVISCLSTQVKYLTKEIFLIYNVILSILLFCYYIKHYLYYDKYINTFAGIFHTLYAWTSIFSLIFGYLNLKEKGIIYIITSFLVFFLYFNIKNILESKIFMEKPYYKIENKFYVLYYLRNIIEKINNIDEKNEDKSFLSSIIQMHSIECPNMGCLLKLKDDIYLPMTNKWSNNTKRKVEDEVFLKNFIIIIMNYFISTHDCSVDMYLNLSLYQLKIIGNYCQAMYYYQKVMEFNLSLKEGFSLARLNIQISKALISKLKPPNDPCPELENLDISQYYKYDFLSQKFFEEINNDINLSLEFWNSFADPLKEYNKKLDFNKIFELTDKIRISKQNIEDMWNELLKIYDGVNDFFQLYMDYIEQINDDDLKRRDLEVLKRKNDSIGEHINNNFYFILFSKNTGIIITNGDKGNEGIIQVINNEIEKIFKYNKSELKGMNVSNLMPKIFSKDHSKYISRYFRIGEKKLIDKSFFSSFAKDKNNYIIKVKLAIKQFPILNQNVFFAGLIIKENIDDIILLDNQYIIQGMSSKLMKILGINNKYLFQDNEIPFYAICKNFVNFYNIFLKGKRKNNSEEEKKIDIKENIKENKEEVEDIHDNIEINENVELEYEIKIPQFLIDFSEKINKNETKKQVQLMENNMNEEEEDKNYDNDENESLLNSEKNDSNRNKKNNNDNSMKYIINIITPTPNSTPTPTPTPTPDGQTANNDSSLISNSIKSDEIEEKNIEFKKYSQEEKIYKNTMNKYKSLFSEGKIDELEELIDKCNKNSSSIEYKFNFTFDKYKYGNNQIAFIVRCIDNKNDAGKTDEESEIDPNPRIEKYKKEKRESIKPLFEVLEEERENIIKMPEEFLKLSLENKNFQKLLQACKNDITNMSKAYGQKKDQILEDENSSQSSQAGFDSGLLKKNRLEEIRGNIMRNISSFYTLKYIKLIIILNAIITLVFSILYSYNSSELNYNLEKTFQLNIALYESTFWTSQLINLFLSLRVLYNKYIIRNITDFDFNDHICYYCNNSNLTETNYIYYNEFISFAGVLYNKTYFSLAYLEMEIPKYLNKEQLSDVFWENIKITYFTDFGFTLNDFAPLSVSQLLSNSLSYIMDDTYNSISEIAFKNYHSNIEKNYLYFNYMTVLIIENAYENILPHFFRKISIIPNVLSNYNSNCKIIIMELILPYGCIFAIIYIIFYFLFFLTGKSMTEGMKKISKLRLEKIEDIIKRIKIFKVILKKFKERNKRSFEEKNNYNLSFQENNDIYEKSKDNLNTEENKNKLKNETFLVNNNGFNTDNKKYIEFTILNNIIYFPYIFSIVILLILVLIYMTSISTIKNTNLLLLVQKYIYGKLLISTYKVIEVKCFMSKCQNKTNLNYSNLLNMSEIQEIIRGINILPEIYEYYNEKFLLDACEAAIDNSKEPQKYNSCRADPLIASINNTDNLIKIIEDNIDYIYKEYQIRNDTEPHYDKIKLFNSTHFRDIEYLFSNYLYSVLEIFTDLINNNLKIYLRNYKQFINIFVISFGVINALFCIIYGIILIKKLITYLTISRCIMKIIPVSTILSSQELESWIDSKY